MWTEHHRIYDNVLSKILTFGISTTCADSSWSTPVHLPVPIDPITNLKLVLVNTASAPLHTLSEHMSDHQCLGLSLCPVLTARLAAITASSLCCPGRVSRVANHTTQPPLQRTTNHHRPMPSITSPSDHWYPVRSMCLSLSR